MPMSQSVVAQAMSYLQGRNGLSKGSAAEPGASGEQLPQSATQGSSLSNVYTKEPRTTLVSCNLWSIAYRV